MKKHILLSFLLLNFGGLFGMFRKNSKSYPVTHELEDMNPPKGGVDIMALIVDVTGQPTKLTNGREHYSPNSPGGQGKSVSQLSNLIRKNSIGSPKAYSDRMELLYAQPVPYPAQALPGDHPLPRFRSQSETAATTKFSKPKKSPKLSPEEVAATRLRFLATTQYFLLDSPDDESSSSDSDDEK